LGGRAVGAREAASERRGAVGGGGAEGAAPARDRARIVAVVTAIVVTAGDVGSHFQRHRRYPAVPVAYGRAARSRGNSGIYLLLPGEADGGLSAIGGTSTSGGTKVGTTRHRGQLIRVQECTILNVRGLAPGPRRSRRKWDPQRPAMTRSWASEKGWVASRMIGAARSPVGRMGVEGPSLRRRSRRFGRGRPRGAAAASADGGGQPAACDNER